MTKILAFDTSTDACCVGLLNDKKVTEYFEITPRRHSDLLLSIIDELLQKAQLTLADLDAIAFGCGPGSFMGVRLAVGVAEGLAYTHSLPLLAISTLQTIAQHAFANMHHHHIVAAWDARMGEIYWGAYQLCRENVMLPVDQDHISSPELITLPESQSWTLVGNAWECYPSQLPMECRQESYLYHPHASAMLVLAQYYFAHNEGLPAGSAKPNYLRQQVAFIPKPI